MSRINIYTDEHVHSAVIQGLRRRGVSVIRCQDVNMRTATDKAHFKYIIEHNYVLYTHDDDFIAMAVRWKREGKIHPGIVYCHQQRYSIGEQIRRLKELTDILETEDMTNTVEFL